MSITDLKYVVGMYKTDWDDLMEVAILFPGYVTHSRVARLFYQVTGAGFYTNESLKVRVFGKSESLGGLQSKERDIEFIEKALGIK